MTKRERLAMILEQLENAPPTNDLGAAYRLLVHVIDSVENAFAGIPFDPHYPRDDGRMYPPLEDNAQWCGPNGDVRRYRSAKHLTHLGPNGAIRIASVFETGNILLDKPGGDGRRIEDFL